mmetsp:Transcript_1736/g.6802  ORF Transcript_1736/g.6802 Transcript_1736/m.6802 type:complete len:383 (-) Transcript_1736:311-1459(-)
MRGGLRRLRQALALHRLLEANGTTDREQYTHDGNEAAVRLHGELVDEQGQELVRDAEDHESRGRHDLPDAHLEVGHRDAEDRGERHGPDGPEPAAAELLPGAGPDLRRGELHGERAEDAEACRQEVLVEHQAPLREARGVDQVFDQHGIHWHHHQEEDHPGGAAHRHSAVHGGVQEGAEQQHAEADPRGRPRAWLAQRQALQKGAGDRHQRPHDDEGVHIGVLHDCVAGGHGDEKHAGRGAKGDQLVPLEPVHLDGTHDAGEPHEQRRGQELKCGQHPDEGEGLQRPLVHHEQQRGGDGVATHQERHSPGRGQRLRMRGLVSRAAAHRRCAAARRQRCANLGRRHRASKIPAVVAEVPSSAAVLVPCGVEHAKLEGISHLLR